MCDLMPIGDNAVDGVLPLALEEVLKAPSCPGIKVADQVAQLLAIRIGEKVQPPLDVSADLGVGLSDCKVAKDVPRGLLQITRYEYT
jgi:hypothetical protein